MHTGPCSLTYLLESTEHSGCAVCRSDADLQQAAHTLEEAVTVATGRAFSNAAGQWHDIHEHRL